MRYKFKPTNTKLKQLEIENETLKSKLHSVESELETYKSLIHIGQLNEMKNKVILELLSKHL